MSRPQVVVIGSGPGGSAIAWALATAGVKVRILEAGPRYNPATDYRLHRNDWEQTPFPEKVPSRGRQTHAPLQNLDTRWDHLRAWNRLHGKLSQSQQRLFGAHYHVIGVGGTVLHYSGESHRLHPDSLNLFSRFGVAAEWPFEYVVLEPFYQAAERAIGVAGPENDPRRPRSAPYPLPPHAMSYASKILGQGCRKMGLSWIPNPVASLSQPYDGRPPCNYCGQCSRGCPRLDKGTPDITLIPKALASGNCTLDTVSQVLSLETGDNDRVKAAIYTDMEGRSHRVEADLFVVACGAVETPRLLLNSAGPQAPDGLGNESGLVGRNFMETLFWAAAALHPEQLASYRGLPSDAVCWDYNTPDAIPGVIGGARFSPATLEVDLSGPMAYARRVVGGWGHQHKAGMRETFGRALAVSGNGESLPNPGSFIDLDPLEKDRFGFPKARIHSHLPEMELKRMDFMAKTCRSILKAAGAGELIEEYGSYDMFSTIYVLGTCRMGTDPATSVVDPYCRSHRWRNLMITDASIFPSSGGGEAPSLSIYANSLRAAHYVKKHGVAGQAIAQPPFGRNSGPLNGQMPPDSGV
jgi:choline dehydrogenase-like flavoprotein